MSVHGCLCNQLAGFVQPFIICITGYGHWQVIIIAIWMKFPCTWNFFIGITGWCILLFIFFDFFFQLLFYPVCLFLTSIILQKFILITYAFFQLENPVFYLFLTFFSRFICLCTLKQHIRPPLCLFFRNQMRFYSHHRFVFFQSRNTRIHRYLYFFPICLKLIRIFFRNWCVTVFLIFSLNRLFQFSLVLIDHNVFCRVFGTAGK